MKKFIGILLALAVAMSATARVNTTRKGLTTQRVATENHVVPLDTVTADTLHGGKRGFVDGGIVLNRLL